MQMQWKILRTKKRLSRLSWEPVVLFFVLLGLGTVLGYVVRTVSLPFAYGMIPVTIPSLTVPMDEFEDIDIGGIQLAESETPVVVLSNEALFLGPLGKFSELRRLSGKSMIPHNMGSPRLDILFSEYQRMQEKKEVSGKVVILVPSPDAPVPILIQMVEGLRSFGEGIHVVIGGGLFI